MCPCAHLRVRACACGGGGGGGGGNRWLSCQRVCDLTVSKFMWIPEN